jgi:hypothetical protein
MFDEHAQLIVLDDVHKQVTADPADINVLPEYAASHPHPQGRPRRNMRHTRAPHRLH